MQRNNFVYMISIITISIITVIIAYVVVGGEKRQSNAAYSSTAEDKVKLLHTEQGGFAGVRNHRSTVRLRSADELEKLIPPEVANERRFETPEKFRAFLKRDMARREKVGNLVLSKLDFTEIEKEAVQKRNEQIQELSQNILSQLDSGAMVVDLKKQLGHRSSEIHDRLKQILGEKKFMLFVTEFARQYSLQNRLQKS